ncbi:hypothetical protein XBFM1_1720041 [Xenorhabdus bovienii str. feltiae Moldova]|uniref:Uncharacterized protein n=1 Tax=Xenorhabdus bovienii str. feltiae Moldova TaxID=1398200 RepID=A0A077NQB5_XENBV|nr:hypothetical protein XBFM1_1720041 [Xenorhabdus bovienii str. feltiae Moldova]
MIVTSVTVNLPNKNVGKFYNYQKNKEVVIFWGIPLDPYNIFTIFVTI